MKREVTGGAWTVLAVWDSSHSAFFLSAVSRICAQCEMEHSADGLMEQMCSSDFGEYGLTGPQPRHCPQQPGSEPALPEQGYNSCVLALAMERPLWLGSFFRGCKLSQRWMEPHRTQDSRIEVEFPVPWNPS